MTMMMMTRIHGTLSDNLQLKDRGTLSLQTSGRILSWKPSFPTTEPDDFERGNQGKVGLGLDEAKAKGTGRDG